jgi:uncharacterized membrane protein
LNGCDGGFLASRFFLSIEHTIDLITVCPEPGSGIVMASFAFYTVIPKGFLLNSRSNPFIIYPEKFLISNLIPKDLG